MGAGWRGVCGVFVDQAPANSRTGGAAKDLSVLPEAGAEARVPHRAAARVGERRDGGGDVLLEREDRAKASREDRDAKSAQDPRAGHARISKTGKGMEGGARTFFAGALRRKDLTARPGRGRRQPRSEASVQLGMLADGLRFQDETSIGANLVLHLQPFP